MQIVIDIDEEYYKYIQDIPQCYRQAIHRVIANGTPLPKSHGRLIDEKETISIITYGKDDKAYFGSTDKDFEVIDFLKTVPTIIEADKGEEE